MFSFFLLAEAKFSSFWNLLLDEKKPLFTTDKFLSQANEESEATLPPCLTNVRHSRQTNSPEPSFASSLLSPPAALLTVLTLCERLFLDHAHRLNGTRSK